MASLFQDCLKPESPPLFRMVLVECLLRIAREGSNLPWNPTISDVYNSHSGSLRDLFNMYSKNIARDYNTLSIATDKKSQKQLDILNFEVEILTKLTRLFHVNPSLPLYPGKQNGLARNIDSTRSVLVGLASCVAQFELTELSERAQDTLLELHQPENIERWCQDKQTPIQGFWEIALAVDIHLAKVLVGSKNLTVEQIQRLVTLLEEIHTQRNCFLDDYKEKALPDASIKDLQSLSSSQLEMALLIHLSSAKVEVCSTCARVFGLLVTQAQIINLHLQELPEDNANTIVCNLQVYRELSVAAVSATGRKAQQKAIWAILRRMDRKTPGTYGGWLDVRERWHTVTEYLLASSEEEGGAPVPSSSRAGKSKRPVVAPPTTRGKDQGEVVQEWTNCSGFLCALSGVTINQETTQQVVVKGKVTEERKVPVLESFMSHLLDLVVSDVVTVRETVKMLIGSALSPAAYSTLFRQLHANVRSFFGAAGQVKFTAQSTLFVDQAISIVKLILELEGSTPDDYTMLTDFEDLLLDLLKFVRQLVPSLSTLNSKSRFCGLLEAMMNRRQYLHIRNEFPFRNAIIENVMEWTTEFTQGGRAEASDAAQMQRKSKELDLHCLRATRSLLVGLALPGADDVAKSKQFSKYFTFLTRLLTRCKKSPSSVLPQVAEVTVQCLSNVVSANIEHGLEYFVNMGYHDDTETRSAFLKVLTNILKQGAEFEDAGESKDKYDKLVDMLRERGLPLVLALCDAVQITEADELSQILVRLFDAHDQVMDLLKCSIDAEVGKTDSPNTLFRRNSMVTKLLAAFGKFVGRDYLKATLGPVLNRMVGEKNVSYELDASKLLSMEPTERETKEVADKVADNLMRVRQTSEEFLASINGSVDNAPLPFRHVCHYLKNAVATKFPGHEHTAVGGFIFLRFLCPAIVAPDGFGLVSGTLSRDLRRGLVLVTKTLQNLANKVKFVKEPYMFPMNPFIDAHLDEVLQLYDRLSALPEGTEQETTSMQVHTSDEQREDDVGRLHYHLSRSQEKVARLLKQSHVRPEFNGRIGDEAEAAQLCDRFQTLVQQLGAPPERQAKPGAQRAQSMRGTNVYYERYMQLMQNKNTDAIKERNIIFQHGRTKEQQTVIYFIARNYRQNVDDSELMIYHCLKVLQNHFNKPWHLVIDTTLFGPENQVSLPIVARVAKLFPTFASENLKRVYFVHPNDWFKKYTKRVISRFVSSQLAKRFVFTTSSGLTEFIPEGSIGLPSSTLSVEKDVVATFSPVYRFTSQYNKKEVTLSLTTDLLQMVSKKTYPVLGSQAQLHDLIHISKLYEIDHAGEEAEFTIKYNWNGQRALVLRSPNFKQIIQQIKASKDRYELSRPSQAKTGKTFRPSDVRGTLLNMSLLNLSSSNISLREAAYNLLVAISQSFNFSVRRQLHEANGMHLPRNNTHFVVRISRQLAVTEKRLTLEFMLESLRGINKTDRLGMHRCLDYVMPWLANLALFHPVSSLPESKELAGKTRQVVLSLITLSIREAAQLGPALLEKVWKPIGRVHSLLGLVLECIVTSTGDPNQGLGTRAMETLEDMTVTVASQNPQLVAGKLVARLVNLIAGTAQNPKSSLERHEAWSAIAVILRLLLMLAFEDLITVQQFLPDVLHAIMMVFSTGDYQVRASVHGLVMNLVHSLYTSLVSASGAEGTTDQERDRLQKLAMHLQDFDQPKFRLLFGIGAMKQASSSVKLGGSREGKGAAAASQKGGAAPIQHVESVAKSLMAVLTSASPGSSCVGTRHHTRWLSLTTAAAFTNNIALQPRAIVTLGVICRSEQLVTEDLFLQVLSLLKYALRRMLTTNMGDLPVSIILCLTRLFEHLPESSRYFTRMFWIAVTLLQINDVRVFSAALGLVEVILKTLDDHDLLNEGVNTYLMRTRAGDLEPMLTKLDQISGISFDTSFSFALSGHLLKGLRHSATKAATTRLLSTLVDLGAVRSVGPSMLGYLVALLPVRGDDSGLRQILAIGDEGAHQWLFNENMVTDKRHAALLFSFLVTILKNSEFEHEQLFIYETLRAGVQASPEAFPVVYEVLIRKMSAVILTSQNKDIIENVLAIMKSMFSYTIPSAERLDKYYLTKIGFQGLTEADSFLEKVSDPQKQKQGEQKRSAITRIACSLLTS
jgi:GTPase-activator protein for Ras-like GTPase/Divergent CRAL/TRIO domain/Cell morphogenesis C-terminal